jgi:hypothetical protein
MARLLGSPTGAAAIADTHVFLQQRVTLFAKILFCFFAAFLFFGCLKTVLLYAGGEQEWAGLSLLSVWLTAAFTLGIGLDWWYLRRGLRPILILHFYESAGTVIACFLVAAMVHLLPEDLPFPAEIGFVFVTVLILVIRAAVVPSSARRTAVVGLLATLAASLPLWQRGAKMTPNPSGQIVWVMSVVWGGIFTIVTMVVSQVIYGLHKRVREAMQLGSYTLEQKLGEGGMGIVYRARHAMLRRQTAVKLLPLEKTGEKAAARFEREVQLTARLTHPNTVTVFDFGRTPDGVFYYAMELLEGASLEDVVRLDGAQPDARVIHVLYHVAGALSEAHGIGLIHRDIKPANIILCTQGGEPDVPKVVDFGLVKDVSGGEGVALTQTESITGTPLYMSPEAVARPDEVDARSDIYALGAVGYYLLTGQHVFTGNTLVEVCGHHLHTPPTPPSKRIAAPVPADLEAILLACLAKDPACRPQSAADLRLGLRRCQGFGAWSSEQARLWWAENAEALRAPAGSMDEEAVTASAPQGVLTVDTQARGAL